MLETGPGIVRRDPRELGEGRTLLGHETFAGAPPKRAAEFGEMRFGVCGTEGMREAFIARTLLSGVLTAPGTVEAISEATDK